MPTNTNAYNSRVTDEALEKRFRDTFRSQGGAELVDDLYAQGVIVPIVDFTQAATGETLAQNLQTAWDFSTGSAQVNAGTTTIITNAGFWQIDLNATVVDLDGSATSLAGSVRIFDGSTRKNIWGVGRGTATVNNGAIATSDRFVVFVRSGDSIEVDSSGLQTVIDVWYRQIATVSGDLINPTGFTSS